MVTYAGVPAVRLPDATGATRHHESRQVCPSLGCDGIAQTGPFTAARRRRPEPGPDVW